ncbi:MAG TPA: ribose-5-phosphate isomerase A, partial [Candidatus Dormibacteraeota bacterium]|nr:ribose-5-phosphate isomerase A [Candidatus Dormibacteraeota bacterium]
PYETDNGNLILDLIIDGGIPDAEDLACRLSQVPGVLAHGLFIKMATGVIVGTPSGEIRILGDAG